MYKTDSTNATPKTLTIHANYSPHIGACTFMSLDYYLFHNIKEKENTQTEAKEQVV